MKDFKAINVGKGIIEVESPCIELIPTELYLKEDGDIHDNPSIAIVMEREGHKKAVGQISLRMLNEGLAEIGYVFQKRLPVNEQDAIVIDELNKL